MVQHDSNSNRRLRRGAVASVIAAAILLLAACQSTVSGAPVAATGPGAAGPAGDSAIDAALPAGLAAPSAGWLVLVYQAAGNDLEAAILDDVHEALSTSDPDVRVLSLLDRSPNSDADSGYSDGESVPGVPEGHGTQLVTIAQGQGQLIAGLPDLPMSDPETLAAFVAAGIRAFPADKVALVIADHGGGWQGAAVDEVAEAAGLPALLDLPAIVAGIANGLERAGRKSLDVIGFDACLMAQWDVALALAPYTDRLVASAETEPGAGWDWSYLADVSGADTPDQLGTTVMNYYASYYQQKPSGRTATMSLIDLSQMRQLDEALSFLSAASVVGGTEEELVWLARARAAAWEYGRSADPESDARLVDLGAFTGVLSQAGGTLGGAADGVTQALGQAVIAQWAGPDTVGASGLSVYLPPSDATTDPSYRQVGDGTLWAEFLGDFHRRIAGLGIAPDFVGLAAPQLTDATPATFAATAPFSAGARGLVVSGALRLGGVQPDGRIDFLRASAADVGDDSMTGHDEFSFFQVTDGSVTLPVYLDQERSAGIPYWYSVGGSDPIPVVVRIAKTEDGSIGALSAVAALPGSTSASRAVLDPSGVLWPRFRTAAADGSDTGWTGLPGGAGLTADLARHSYRFGVIPSGSQVAVQFSLMLANGEETSSTVIVSVP